MNTRVENMAPGAGVEGAGPKPGGGRIGASGIRGVRYYGGRWYAYTRINHKPKYIGNYKTKEEAALAKAVFERSLQQTEGDP